MQPVNYKALTPAQRRNVRVRYIAHQHNKCHHCNESLSGKPAATITEFSSLIDWRKFPRGFLNHPIHLHHSHKTGLTIGAVHALCNAALWQFHGE